MTYGEYYYLLKYDMKLVDGIWVTKKPSIKIPPRMSNKEASKYYTLKFQNYWDSLK